MSLTRKTRRFFQFQIQKWMNKNHGLQNNFGIQNFGLQNYSGLGSQNEKRMEEKMCDMYVF